MLFPRLAVVQTQHRVLSAPAPRVLGTVLRDFACFSSDPHGGPVGGDCRPLSMRENRGLKSRSCLRPQHLPRHPDAPPLPGRGAQLPPLAEPKRRESSQGGGSCGSLDPHPPPTLEGQCRLRGAVGAGAWLRHRLQQVATARPGEKGSGSEHMTEVVCDAHVGMVSTGASQESRDRGLSCPVQVPRGRSWAAPQCSPSALLCGLWAARGSRQRWAQTVVGSVCPPRTSMSCPEQVARVSQHLCRGPQM